ncbi:uncharacterized protein LOC133908596 [Phragmites australis]|uniref:uncharacterized protein LOC133908596 n=1 Tax=Phragmites australis TaxID=29695 RepID=UPI002D76D4AB|nr:uncharacterized protein LOC133908596 [Phragmites australis]
MAAAQKLTIQTSLTKPLKPCQPTKPCDGTKPASASGDRHGSSLTPVFAFIILGANCAAAIYNSRHDPWAVAFVLASFLILVSLFYALRVFETLPRGSPRRAHAKAAVWSLSTVLTLMFSHRVAALLPLPVAVVVWVMAGSTIFAGFYMLFVCRDDRGATEEEAPAKLADIA